MRSVPFTVVAILAAMGCQEGKKPPADGGPTDGGCPNRGTKYVAHKITTQGEQSCSQQIGEEIKRWKCARKETEEPGHETCAEAGGAPGMRCVFVENRPVHVYDIGCGSFLNQCVRGPPAQTGQRQHFGARPCE
jgi:hypothetical protein